VLLDFRHIIVDSPKQILDFVTRNVPKNTKIEIIARGVISDINKKDPNIKIFKESIEEVLKSPATFIRKHGASDTRFLIAKGSVGVDFGPRGIGLHSNDEYVDIKSISQYASILKNFLTKIESMIK
jgi:succinyl-diaminopimelate desuccinylase